MWSRNSLTERLNLEWPILQAPMGDKTTPALAGAVSNAGALGGLGMSGLTADTVRRRIEGFRQLSAGSLNVNYLLWEHTGDLTGAGTTMRGRLQTLYDTKKLGAVPVPVGSESAVDFDHLSVLKDTSPEVISFHFGLPAPKICRELKANGIFLICSATTVAEALALEASGADAVIAQGTEAGGHRGTFTGVEMNMQPGLFALLPQMVDAVTIPVIAAGGIANGRTVAAALMLGASAVQLGTAFLRCEEANVHAAHREALGTASDSATVVTDVISGRPARYIRNALINELGAEEPLPFPDQLRLTAPLGANGDGQYMALYAGQSAALTTDLPAADLVHKLAVDASACFAAFK
ncbi:MAG: nitronate monooxygenase [Chromatiales bacterium]|nr:nitronate monooxygenase [Chromatiales bacterium]